MRSHIPPHEREAIAKTHLCSYCGEGFANSSNLNVHIRKHTGNTLSPHSIDKDFKNIYRPQVNDHLSVIFAAPDLGGRVI